MRSLCWLLVDKSHHFGQILTFGGSCTFTAEGQIWCTRADPWYTLTGQISSGSVYSVTLWWRETPKFCVFCSVATWQQSEKVEHRCTTTKLPLSNGVKIVSVLQCHHGEIGRTQTDVQKYDEQTDRHTKTSTFLADPQGRG